MAESDARVQTRIRIVAAQGLRNVGELIAIVRDDGDTRLPAMASKSSSGLPLSPQTSATTA
jgi:hypothetical protein